MFKIDCNEITSDQYFNFIKKNCDTKENISIGTKHHINYFEKYKKTASFVNWNWSAAFITTPWMLYRKMYMAFFLTCIFLDIHFLLAKPFVNAKTFATFSIIWLIINIITFGSVSDYFYLVFATHKIKKGIIHKGVSFKGPIIFIIALIFLLSALPFVLFSLMLYFPSLVPILSSLTSMYGVS